RGGNSLPPPFPPFCTTVTSRRPAYRARTAPAHSADLVTLGHPALPSAPPPERLPPPLS
ncbi:hypothetical protein KI387_002054, partial [Taxus chinensis]